MHIIAPRNEQHNYQGPPLQATYYCIDVECVATGTDHNSRAVGQISLVSQFEQVLLNIYVKPPVPVVSFLTPLTGLTKELLDKHGIPLADAVTHVKQTLPKHAVLVGQNLMKDVEWLGLKEGTDFAGMMDLAGLYRARTEEGRWFIFGQDHVARVLLNWQDSPDGTHAHDAVTDAIKSIRLFNHYQVLQAMPGALEHAKQALIASPVIPSFAKRNATYEGVCMGNRKQCTCGAPWFS